MLYASPGREPCIPVHKPYPLHVHAQGRCNSDPNARSVTIMITGLQPFYRPISRGSLPFQPC